MSVSTSKELNEAPDLSPSSSSSPRRPLREQSPSQRNRPTIRIVESDSNVYAKSPFPSHPSQILKPGRYAQLRGRFVSDEQSTSTNHADPKPSKSEAAVPGPLQTRNPNRASISTSTTTSDLDNSLSTGATHFSSTSSRYSAFTSNPSSPVDEEDDKSDSRLPPVLEDFTLGTSAARPTIRAVHSSSPPNVSTRLVDNPSEISLVSSDPFDTRLTHDRGDLYLSSSPRNYEVLSNSSLISLPVLPPIDQIVTAQSASKPLPNYPSVESLAFSDTSYSSNAERPRSASSPTNTSHAGLRVAYKSGAKIQYPSIKASSADSRAENQALKSKPLPRMTDGQYRPAVWSSRLSTIASESTERTSQSLSSGGLYNPRRRRTIGSIASDGNAAMASPSEEPSSVWEEGSGVLTGSESNVSLPYPSPLFAPISSRPLPAIPGETGGEKDSEEREDILGELQPPPTLRQPRSGLLGRYRPGSSRPSSADSMQSHISSISFKGDLAWAKRYYSNGEPVNLVNRSMLAISTDSGSSARLTTATTTNSTADTASPLSETFPNRLWRPRNRPRQARAQSRTRSSLAITEESAATDQVDSSRRSRATLSISEMMFSPHLGRDRRATMRYSAWQAPSLEDNPFGRRMFGRTNRQILLFCVGFICPLAWMLAAFLPLPKRPPAYAIPEAVSSVAQMSEYGTRTQIYSQSVVPSEKTIDEKRFQKAHWWRTANRILSVFGLLIIAAVVILAVLGTRMRKRQQASSQ